jgi:hypothetical protein
MCVYVMLKCKDAIEIDRNKKKVFVNVCMNLCMRVCAPGKRVQETMEIYDAKKKKTPMLIWSPSYSSIAISVQLSNVATCVCVYVCIMTWP